jgi:hypothetical protein
MFGSCGLLWTLNIFESTVGWLNVASPVRERATLAAECLSTEMDRSRAVALALRGTERVGNHLHMESGLSL